MKRGARCSSLGHAVAERRVYAQIGVSEAGLLQTEEYARAILTAGQRGRTGETSIGTPAPARCGNAG